MNETNLSKIHIFPSEASYNSNKGSVGSSDLALVPNISITELSVSGRTITYTKGDGTTGTITTQDTVPSRYITSKYSNGTEWYVVYNDGWVRQGGYINNNGSANDYRATVTFLKAFKDTNYTLVGIGCPTNVSDDYNDYVERFTATQFVWRTRGSGSAKWIAEGYGA